VLCHSSSGGGGDRSKGGHKGLGLVLSRGGVVRGKEGVGLVVIPLSKEGDGVIALAVEVIIRLSQERLKSLLILVFVLVPLYIILEVLLNTLLEFLSSLVAFALRVVSGPTAWLLAHYTLLRAVVIFARRTRCSRA